MTGRRREVAVVAGLAGELAAAQLIETATTPVAFRAVLTAVNRSEKELLLASTSRMFAPGAMACATSTSRAISVDQLLLAAGIVVPPF